MHVPNTSLTLLKIMEQLFKYHSSYTPHPHIALYSKNKNIAEILASNRLITYQIFLKTTQI